MAAKSALKTAVVPVHGNHPHCKLCGSCLTTGSNFHPCRPEPIDLEVLAVVLLETRSVPARATAVPIEADKL